MVTFKNNQVVADVENENLDLFLDSIKTSLSTLGAQIYQDQHDILFCKGDFYKERIESLQMMYDFLFEIYHVCFAAKEDF